MKYFLVKSSDGSLLAVPLERVDGVEEVEKVFSIPFYRGKDLKGAVVFREKIYAIINRVNAEHMLFLFLRGGRTIQIEGILATVEDEKVEQEEGWLLYGGERYRIIEFAE